MDGGPLIATSIAGYLHQLTATPTPDGGLLGWGVRESKAMIATLRHRLIRIPARLIHHAGTLTLRLPPSHQLLTEILSRLRALPTRNRVRRLWGTLTRPEHSQAHVDYWSN